MVNGTYDSNTVNVSSPEFPFIDCLAQEGRETIDPDAVISHHTIVQNINVMLFNVNINQVSVLDAKLFPSGISHTMSCPRCCSLKLFYFPNSKQSILKLYTYLLYK